MAIEFSTQLDRMEKLLIAAGISSPVTPTSSFPTAHLDVEECYKQLNNLKKTRPEDIVMRQALELYCSLMSPPTTPSSSSTSDYESQQEKATEKVASSPNYHEERGYPSPTIVYAEHGASNEHHQAYANNPKLGYYDVAHACNDYSCSTVSSVSDHDDSDDMDDDPFACYPLSYPNRVATYSHPEPSPVQAPKPRRNVSGSKPKTSGGTTAMTKAASVDVQSTGSNMASAPGTTHFNLNVQPSSDSKPSGRKRAFSVVSLGKHRKAHSGNSSTLRISGPTPLHVQHSFSGTFSTQTQNHRHSGRRLSLLGCLSPAMEESEDITPTKTPSSFLLSRSSTSSSENIQSMNISNKFSSRSESKSIWKTLKS